MCNIPYLVIWWYWCWCQWQMMPIVSSMAIFHLLGQDDQKEMQHDVFGPVLPLAPALCDTNHIFNGTTALTRSRPLKQEGTFCSCDVIGTCVGITLCQCHHKWHHYIPYVEMIDMSFNMTFLAMWHNWFGITCCWWHHDLFGHVMTLASL